MERDKIILAARGLELLKIAHTLKRYLEVALLSNRLNPLLSKLDRNGLFGQAK